MSFSLIYFDDLFISRLEFSQVFQWMFLFIFTRFDAKTSGHHRNNFCFVSERICGVSSPNFPPFQANFEAHLQPISIANFWLLQNKFSVVFSDPFWTHFRPILDPFRTYLGPILDLSWTHHGPILDPFWTHFGPILDPSWTHFGPILDLSWTHFVLILDPFWTHLDPSWTHLGPILDPSWTNFGPILGPFRTHFESFYLVDCNGFTQRIFGGISNVSAADIQRNVRRLSS